MNTTKQITKAIKEASKAKTQGYDTTATVTRVEGDTVWIHIPGGVDETPVKKTVNASVGDVVQARVAGGSAWLVGNASAPPTDDTTADDAKEKAVKAGITAKEAKEVAENVGKMTEKVTQYFWHTETDTGAGAGAHITKIPKDDFLADPSNGGGNTLLTSDGMTVRDGLTELAIFGADGARIGDVNKAHSVIDDKGQRFYAVDGTTQLANIGYGEGASASGSSTAPYYDFGIRQSNTTIGNYSIAAGLNVTASGYSSHAEGDSCAATGHQSHAEGSMTGATGLASHSEGWETGADGDYSHSQNEGTIANKKGQTVLGTYNIVDMGSSRLDYGDYAVIIGNGGDTNNRSNALTVDWSGNVEAAGALFSSGAEFSKKTGNHIVVGGIHICWGAETIAATANTYSEVQVTLPYTYQSNPICLASLGNRVAAARTAYATQGSLAGNKIYVGCYSTAARDIYISWMTIGV